VRTVNVTTALEMQQAVEAALPADIAVMAAAVGDWRVEASAEKLKKDGSGSGSLTLIENPDILAGLARHRRRPQFVIGFAAETQDLIANAQAKLKKKAADWIVANDVSPATGIMGGMRNRVHLVSADGVESWPEMTKDEVARKLVERIAGHFPSPLAGEGQRGGKDEGSGSSLPPSSSLPRKRGEGAPRGG
jgi:phosphopantothenoylcysteine decarboxylase/phosphopantothenate--cysteine ligase